MLARRIYAQFVVDCGQLQSIQCDDCHASASVVLSCFNRFCHFGFGCEVLFERLSERAGTRSVQDFNVPQTDAYGCVEELVDLRYRFGNAESPDVDTLLDAWQTPVARVDWSNGS